MTQIGAFTNSVGNLSIQDVANPSEGRMVVPLSVQLTPALFAVESDMALNLLGVSQVCSVFIDNSENDQALTVLHGVTNIPFTIPAFSTSNFRTESAPAPQGSGSYFLGISMAEAPENPVTLNIKLFNTPQQSETVSKILNANITAADVTIQNATLQSANINQTTDTIVKSSKPQLQRVTSSIFQVDTNQWTLLLPANSRRQDVCFEYYGPTIGQISFLGTAGSSVFSITTAAGSRSLGELFNGIWKGAIYGASGDNTLNNLGVTEFSQNDYSFGGIIGTIGFTAPPLLLFGATALEGSGRTLNTKGIVSGPNNTFEFWVCPSSNGAGLITTMTQTGANGGFQFGVNLVAGTAGPKINIDAIFAAQTVNANSVNELALNKWSHIALVSEDDQTSIYINGVLDSSAPVAMAFTNSTQCVMVIGQINGWLQEMAMWNSPKYLNNFTPQMAPYSGQEAGLFALWHMVSDAADTGPGVLLS